MKTIKIIVAAIIIITAILSILMSMSNPEEYERQLSPDQNYTVVSVKQVKIDTIFMHYYNIRVGFLNNNRIQFMDFSMDSDNIIYSNTTSLTRKNTRLWGNPYDYLLYWNGTEY